MSERDPNEIGALWSKQGPRGEYMTGKIGDQPVVCFRVTGGNNPKAPQWRVLKLIAKHPGEGLQHEADEGPAF